MALSAAVAPAGDRTVLGPSCEHEMAGCANTSFVRAVGAQEPVVLRDFEREARRADILFVEGLQDAAAVEAVLRSAPGVPTLVAFGCAPALRGAQRLGGLPLAPAGCAH